MKNQGLLTQRIYVQTLYVKYSVHVQYITTIVGDKRTQVVKMGVT